MIEDYEKNPTEETLKTIFSTLNLISIPSELPGSIDVSIFDRSITLNFSKLVVADQIFPVSFLFLR